MICLLLGCLNHPNKNLAGNYMKITNIKSLFLTAAIVSTFCIFDINAEENQKEPFMNKDQVNGSVEEAKGKVKEVAGKILDDKSMETEGTIQKNVGKIQKGIGDIKEDINKDK